MIDSNEDQIRSLRDETSETQMRGLSIEGERTIGLTSFINEASVATHVNKGVSAPSSLLPDDAYQDVKAFFERPRFIASGNLPTSRALVYTLDIANPISLWPTSAQNRLNGALGYSCDIKFTITLSATPFQQGLACLNFQYATTSLEGVSHKRCVFSPLCTNLPHVRLDVAEHTMAELYVPYVSPWNYFELINDNFSGGDGFTYPYGSFGFNMLLQYFTLAGSSDPEYNVFISLHNMKLYGAIPVSVSNVIPQSGVTGTMNKEANDTRSMLQKVKDSKAISNSLHVGAVAAPLVGAAATAYTGNPEIFADSVQASWQLEAAAVTAQSMGFSKPTDQAAIPRFYRTDYASDHHVDQPAQELAIAPFQSNRLAEDWTQSSTAIDEMALPFVLGQYCQAFVGTMSTTDGQGTILYATNLSPTSMWFKTNAGRPGGNTPLPPSASLTTNCVLPTALCYVSQMFRYWRGSIKFKFTFSKTKFHGGRVLAAFVPMTNDVPGTTVSSNRVPIPEIVNTRVQPFQYSAIFDLRDGNTFEFEVPYVSNRPWLSTYGSVGGVTLTIMDRLIASGEVSSNITFMVEVAAGTDYQLGSFIGSGLAPATGANTNLVVFQSGLNDRVVDDSAYTMGETFTSLKQLLLIPCNTSFTSTASSPITTAYLPNWWYAPLLPNTVPLNDNSAALFAMSTQHCIARLYAFCTGGTSYHMYMSNSDTIVTITTANAEAGGTGFTSAFSDPRRRQSSAKPKLLKGSGVSALHAKVPSYQKVSRIPTNAAFYTSNLTLANTPQYLSTAGNLFVGSVPFMSYNNSLSGVATNYVFGYAGSDDARAFGYIGPPPCWLAQSTRTQAIDPAGGITWY